MVLDGTIAPAKVEQVPAALPAWMLIGIARDHDAARQLAVQRIDFLRQDIPKDGASHSEWLRFAERHAEIVDAGRSLATTDAFASDPMVDIARAIDTALFGWLDSKLDGLSSNSFASAPSIVHQIALHIAHRRQRGERRQALIVVDGIALDQWLILERRLRAVRPDVLVDSRSCFAWLPTLTGVSRQAIFTGDQPRAFARTLGSTSAEPVAWRRFWLNEGLLENQVFYAKGLGRPRSCDDIIGGPVADGTEVIGLVVDTVDELFHGELFGNHEFVGRIDHWLALGEWDRLVHSLIDADYHIYVTADHGNVDAVGMGRPSEGSIAEARGERVRIYDSEALRAKSSTTISQQLHSATGWVAPHLQAVICPAWARVHLRRAACRRAWGNILGGGNRPVRQDLEKGKTVSAPPSQIGMDRFVNAEWMDLAAAVVRQEMTVAGLHARVAADIPGVQVQRKTIGIIGSGTVLGVNSQAARRS